MAAAAPRRARGVTAALVIGSIVPDADIVLFPRWFDVYFLHVHPSVTHSVAWSFVEAFAFAALLRWLVRPSRFWVLLAAGWIGILGHIASDLIDGSDVAVFAPLSRVQYGTHLFPMAEPAVMLALAVPCLVAWQWPARGRQAAAACFAALALFLGAKIATQRAAAVRYRRSVPLPQREIELVPLRNRLFTWDVFDQVDGTVRAWRIDVRSGRRELVLEHRNATGPLVAASRALPMVRDLLALTRIPLARIERQGAHEVVLWSDARMCSPERCDVSFGGVFAPDGSPQFQVIRLGEFQEIRPL